MTVEQKQLRELFERSEAKLRRDNCMKAAIFAAVFMLVGSLLDAVVYPDLLGRFLNIRMASAVLLIGGGWLVLKSNHELLSRSLTHLLVLIPVVSIDLMIIIAGDQHSAYYGGINLVLVGSALLLNWRVKDSVISVTLCFVTFVVTMGLTQVTYTQAFIPSYFVFVTGAISILASAFYSSIRFREFQLIRTLGQTNEKLKAIDETKSQFFANLSHELRTPLTLILGPTENLRQNAAISGDPLMEEHLDTIEDNGYRLLRLINDILDLVKLDSGESPPRPETVNLPEFINGLTSNLRPVASLKGIDISCRCNAPGRENVWIDRDRLEKIILNLAVNAVKFTGKGGSVEIAADVEEENLHLWVKDTGEGMSEEDSKNVFVRFWQADMSARRKHRGAGIGLSLVKSLVDSMDGSISVESKLGEGTSFHVYLSALSPEKEGQGDSYDKKAGGDVLERFNEAARSRHVSNAVISVETLEEAEAEEVEAVAKTARAAELPGSGKKRVLIADDEEAMRKFIVRQLKDYEVVQASDGRQAWRLANELQPDLVILDLMMPGLDGIEVARKLRQSEGLSRVPIILITAQASEAPRLEALEAGVNDFISKPFSTVELTVRARNLLDSSEFEVMLAENNVQLEEAYKQLKEQESLLVQSEKLSSLGQMSAGIVHEVNNPLNYAKTALHALKTFDRNLDEDSREDYLEVLADAREGVERVIGIVTDLRAFTRGDETLMEEVKLHQVLESARRLASADLSGIDFRDEVPADLEIHGNEGQLCQLFVNFFQNAARAIEVKEAGDEQGLVVVTATKVEEGGVAVVVHDNGCGISEEDQKLMFDPFFTKNDVGEGMGLGLSICHRILKQHRAKIRVDSKVGEFTALHIDFVEGGSG